MLLPLRSETDTTEKTLDHLAGYRGSRPVRRGNRAVIQFQLDNWGHLLQAFSFWKHVGGRFDRPKHDLAATALDMVRRSGREPDNGIWEESKPALFTYGKVASWLTVQRAADLGLIAKTDAAELATKIRDETLSRGVNGEDGEEYLAAEFENDLVDCASLLAGTNGFLPEELACQTRCVIEKRLVSDGLSGSLLYRSDTHRKRGEGAFVLCTFWLIDHLLREGEISRAEELLQSAIAQVSPLGLFAEQIDPASGEFLGNFPQALSHLGLLVSILNVERAKSDLRFARMT